MTNTKRRIRADLKEVAKSKKWMPLIDCCPDDDNLMLVHVLIEGPDDTPYSGGFFYFTVRFSDDYPLSTPEVRHHTTDSGQVSLNPILTRDGRVSLNILNTCCCNENAWYPTKSLRIVLLSIQSMLTEEPLYNDPWYDVMKGQMSEESKKYNEKIEYEVLRVAVVGMLENSRDAQGMPKKLREVMYKRFKMNLEKYAERLDQIQVPENDSWMDWLWRLIGLSPAKQDLNLKLKQLKERLVKLRNAFDLTNQFTIQIDDPIDEPISLINLFS